MCTEVFCGRNKIKTKASLKVQIYGTPAGLTKSHSENKHHLNNKRNARIRTLAVKRNILN